MIEKKPFVRYDLEKKDDMVLVRLNEDEREVLEKAKSILEQERDATTIKQLMIIGFTNVYQDQKTRTILSTVFKNKRNNKRQGIVTFE
jgi:hypothetical protein